MRLGCVTLIAQPTPTTLSYAPCSAAYMPVMRLLPELSTLSITEAKA